MKIKQKNKILFFIILIIIISLGGFLTWVHFNKSDNKIVTTNRNKQEKIESIDTTEKTQNNDNQKNNISNNKNTPQKGSSNNTDHIEGKTNSSTGITTFNVYTTIQVTNKSINISAQIAGLLYDDGTGKCNYILSDNRGTNIELTSNILESPGNKYCSSVSKKFDELKPGDWSVTAIYKNENQKYEGRSNAQNFKVE